MKFYTIFLKNVPNNNFDLFDSPKFIQSFYNPAKNRINSIQYLYIRKRKEKSPPTI